MTPSRPFDCLVVDAFGTIASLPAKTRPYALLRALLSDHGLETTGFSTAVMTHPWGLDQTAIHYGWQGATDFPVLRQALAQDLATLTLLPAAIECIRLVSQEIPVVIGSNLALPYGDRLFEIFASQGMALAPRPRAHGVSSGFSYNLGSVKPDPSFYAAIAQAVACDPGRILMVGDRAHEDQLAPMAAGWRALCAQPRSSDAKEWSRITSLALGD